MIKPYSQENGEKDMQQSIFEYGGKHFAPVRKFKKKDGDFYQITRKIGRASCRERVLVTV